MELDRRDLVAVSLAALVAQPGDLLAQAPMLSMKAKDYRIWQTVEYRNGTFFYSNPRSIRTSFADDAVYNDTTVYQGCGAVPIGLRCGFTRI